MWAAGKEGCQGADAVGKQPKNPRKLTYSPKKGTTVDGKTLVNNGRNYLSLNWWSLDFWSINSISVGNTSEPTIDFSGAMFVSFREGIACIRCSSDTFYLSFSIDCGCMWAYTHAGVYICIYIDKYRYIYDIYVLCSHNIYVHIFFEYICIYIYLYVYIHIRILRNVSEGIMFLGEVCQILTCKGFFPRWPGGWFGTRLGGILWCRFVVGAAWWRCSL